MIYTKAYLSRPDTVVDYLGRYSRKTALNDRRIVGIEDHTVRLRYKDYTEDLPQNNIYILLCRVMLLVWRQS